VSIKKDRTADNAIIIILERRDEMAIDDELEWYLERLAGHADRRVGLMDSCRELMADQEEEHKAA